MVLERDAVFLRSGCYAVSAVDPRKPQSSVLFEMDFATMSRAMLQEGSELWVLISSTVYSRILKEAHAQGTKIMLSVSQELHAKLKQDPQGSRLLRVVYVLGGSSNGATHKIPGRVSDISLVGAGSYVDRDAGCAGATGDVFRGDLDGAQAAFAEYLGILQGLTAQDPSNTGWQREQAVAYSRVGDVAQMRGDAGRPTTLPLNLPPEKA
jgi:hypothetical protein